MKIFNRFGVLAAIGLAASIVKADSLISCDEAGKLTEDQCSSTVYCYGTSENGKAIYPLGALDSEGKCTFNPTAIPVNTEAKSASSQNSYFFFDSEGGLITTSGTIASSYQCGKEDTSECTNLEDISSAANKYYINSAVSGLSGALVSYGSSGSSLIDAKSGTYYPGNGGLVVCESDGCNLETISSGVKYYLSSLVGYVIKCTQNGCDSIPITSETYFMNAGMEEGEKANQLIYCNGSQCETLTTTSGNYIDGNTGGIINCNSSGCTPDAEVENFYLSTNPNILIDCTSKPCENVQAKIGIYKAGEIDNVTGSRYLSCDATSCNELSETEINKIPTCNVSSNKCTVKVNVEGNAEANQLIPEGGYCIDSSGVLYFATNTIELEDSIVVTSSSNCIQASQTYYQYYYTVGPTIYHVDDCEISQITAPGYYFINTSTNKLVTGSKIEDYNDSFVKLYKCNGVSCVVIPNPSSTTYYVDVSKRIFKYTGNTFTFAYDKDVLCAYSNNKCIPNTDLKSTEFCVTSAGELVIAASDIEAKKSGNCYKSTTMTNEIFGFSSNLYKLNLYDATIIDSTGYYLITTSTNSTTEYKEFTSKNSDITLYGCTTSSCSVRTPEDRVYYYDAISKYLVRYDASTSQWIYPTSDGYAYVSTEPGDKYIRKFTIDSTSTNKVTLTERVSDGYYFTTDSEMYECPNTEGSSCELINESMYVMTNDNELYYCNVDDDSLTSTVCNKQSCVLGELYYIGGYHFRCVTGNIFNILSTKYCNNDELVVVNFPTAFSETYPSNVKNAVDEIAKNNNNTATVKAGSNHLTVIPGIFTNCTYDKEEKMASFDLVCIENYVVLDNEKEPQICSTSKLGFVGCNEDSDNPDKCNPSSAMTIFLSKVAVAFAMLFLGFMLY